MPEVITSLQNPRVKRAARLRDARGRARQGRLVIDGLREIRRAGEGGLRIDEVFVCAEMLADEGRDLLLELEAGDVDLVHVAPRVMQRLSFGDRHPGLLAVAETPRRTLADLELPADSLVAVLEGLEKPGNVGAVLRSADGAGVDAVIVCDGGTDLYNPNTIRASLGVIFSLPTCAATSAQTLEWLATRRFRILAARVEADRWYTEADYHGPVAIVLGSEASGLSVAWQDQHVQGIRLPMRGRADSLNVSAAAAVLFYEALRQRSAK